MRDRDLNDAPPHYTAAEASAWGSGFDACAQRHVEPLVDLLERILAVPQAAPWLASAGGLYEEARRLAAEAKSS